MHLLNTLPQRLDPGATPTFAGLIAPSLTSPAATNLTLGTTSYGTALTVASATGAITATTTLADQGGTISAQRNGLAPAQALVFDGTTAATVAVPAMTDGTVAFWINAPAYSGTTSFPVVGAIGSYSTIYVNTSGAIANEGLSQSTSLLPAGVWSFGAVTKSGTTVTYYVNGIAAGSQTQAQSWNASSKIGLLSGSPFPATLRPPVILNRALSAAEVLALYQTSAPAGADYNTASNTAINTSTVTTSGSGSISGTSASGFAAIATAGYFVRSAPAIAMRTGTRYRVVFTASVLTGTWNVYFSNGAAVGSATPPITAGVNTVEFTSLNANSNWVEFGCGGAGTLTVSSFTFVALGLLLAPDSNNAGAGLEWLDVSGNRAHIVLPTSGVSWSLPSSQQIVIEASTSTNGNQQLGGASLIDTNKQWRIQSWTVNSTGTPTISLGNVSAGAQFVSGAVMASGNNDITLVTRFPSTANLWVNSNSTATLIHRITLVPAN